MLPSWPARARAHMRLQQMVPTWGERCGLAVFAGTLHAVLTKRGVVIATGGMGAVDASADIVIVHHHPEVLADEAIVDLCRRSPRPVVVFAHEAGADGACTRAAGVLSMCAGMVGNVAVPQHVFPHPAWVPPVIEDRAALRRQLGWPVEARILGTSGFLKFDRQLPEVLALLLPEAELCGWRVVALTSPWRLESPGLLQALQSLEHLYPALYVHHMFQNPAQLNRQFQACDLLWCWTAAPSIPYASGVISDQYASGTRVVAPDKLQHRHVLSLPNAVATPPTLEAFVNVLIAEARSDAAVRHDPAPVSWDAQLPPLLEFLCFVAKS